MSGDKLMFNIQLFEDTSMGETGPELIMRVWAKNTFEAGLRKSFFDKFTGTLPGSIIQVKEELTHQFGDKIIIPLLMPLTGAGFEGDNELESNEEILIYPDFVVQIGQILNA